MNPGGMIDENIYRVAGKFELLARILPKFFSTGHRVRQWLKWADKILTTGVIRSLSSSK